MKQHTTLLLIFAFSILGPMFGLSGAAWAQDNVQGPQKGPLPPKVSAEKISTEKVTPPAPLFGGVPSLQASRRSGVIKIDGFLDEEDWKRAAPITDFSERTPVPRRTPAVETEVRVLFDEGAIYVGVRLALPPGSSPKSLQMERDSFRIWADEALTIKFDVRRDRRTTVGFVINPAGTQFDYIALENGAVFRPEYDAVWEAATHIEDGAWYAEFRLPSAALGIPKGEGERVMGLNIARDYNAGAAVYYWPFISPEFNTTSARLYGDLRGIEGIGGGKPLVFRPYALGEFNPIRGGNKTGQTFSPKAGGNLSMRLGEDIWAEVTLFTDFAEVDSDDAIVNLGRFPIFLPEKRPFFLSGLDVFEFGRPQQSQIFFSRRIGLREDILGGMKLYGRSGDWSFGVLDIITAEGEPSPPNISGSSPPIAPSSNWSIARVRYNTSRQGNIGAMLGMRHDLSEPVQLVEEGTASPTKRPTSHYSLGLDGRTRSKDGRWGINAFTAVTITPQEEPPTEQTPADDAYGVSSSIEGSFRGQNFRPSSGVLFTSEDFNPELGLIRRRDVVDLHARLPWTERTQFAGLEEVVTDLSGSVLISPKNGDPLGQNTKLEHLWRWKNKWVAKVWGRLEEDRVEESFNIAKRAPVDAGTYNFGEVAVDISSPYLRNPNAGFTYRTGTFYGATQQALGLRSDLFLTRHFHLTGSLNLTHLNFPNINPFWTTALNTRLTIAASSRLLMVLIAQYNSTQEVWSGLARIRWRYSPGSDLILVYNEGLSVEGGRTLSQATTNFRSVLLKVSHRFETSF